MKTYTHNSVCVVKSFFYSISMVNINIEVKHSWIKFQKFKNAKNYVIYITKTTCFRFFCMMKPARPVDHCITLARNNQVSSINASSCCESAKVKHSFKPWAVKGLIDFKDRTQSIIILYLPFIQMFLGRILLNNSIGFRRDPSLEIFDIEGMVEHLNFL